MKFVSLIALCLWSIAANATHIVGGEIYYDCMGNNNYLITLKVYRDCGPSNTNNTQYDSQAPVGIYDANGTLVATELFDFPGADEVPVVLNSPCLAAPPDVCVEEAIYVGIVNLPPINGGYDIVYQRCCRNPTIVNIINPDDNGATWTCHIPGPNEANCNSSARYSNFPPIALCAGEPMEFDHSATDPDGDSLVYSMCSPFSGASPGSPSPNPPSAPPYNTVWWNAGFSGGYQIDANPAFTIDPHSGLLTGTPTNLGQYVFGVCVEEYRDGILLSVNKRDFQFNVASCLTNTTAIVAPPGDDCSGLSIDFQNNSLQSDYFWWDFGDPTTVADTSLAHSPTYNYPDSGTYTVTLVANPGWPCADTTQIQIDVVEGVTASFPAMPPQCIEGNNFGFSAFGNYTSDATWLWDFGPNATPQTDTLPHPTGIEYSNFGEQEYSLTLSDFGCTEVFTGSVYVQPPGPDPSVLLASKNGCPPFEVEFQDATNSAVPLEYLWEFGDGTRSDDPNPAHTYTAPGFYSVDLTVFAENTCNDTAVLADPVFITVYQMPLAGFTVDFTERSLWEPHFTFSSEAYGSTECQYLLGNGTLISDCSPFTYTYRDTGHYDVAQVVINDYGCTDTVWKEVVVLPEYLFFIANAFTPNGNGLNDRFKPEVDGVLDYEFYIYNRWGEQIFATNNPNEGWDGTSGFNGRPSQTGVYTYIVRTVDVKRKRHEYVGHVTLVK